MPSFSRKVVGTLCRMTLAVMIFNLAVPVLIAQSDGPCVTNPNLNGCSSVSLDLRLAPTSLQVTPVQSSVNEGDPAIQLKAMAIYNYPEANPPIPNKDVTNDSATIWAVDNSNIALVNTIGEVTPVRGSATAHVTATYLGKSGTATVNVIAPTPPVEDRGIVGGGGEGGASSSSTSAPGTDSTSAAESGTTTTPAETPTFTLPNISEPGSTPTNETNNPPAAAAQSPGFNPPTMESNPGAVPTQGIGNQPSAGTAYLPMERPYTPTETRPAAEVIPGTETPSSISPTEAGPLPGVSRSFVVGKIAEKLHILQLRKDLLDKCYKDLENCTAIFRMYSSFPDIDLRKDNLTLFPDLENVPEKDVINQMALLGIVQGYYGIRMSPFLPLKSISKAETSKILTSIVVNLQKSGPDYVAPKFDFNSLFYQEIYAASLLSVEPSSPSSLINTNVPAPIVSVLKVAHALTDEAWSLIKQQKTPFSDVRPDLYDAHWYYPIVYNKICELQIMPCVPGSQIKPDQSPTPEEVDKLISNFDKYIKTEHLDAELSADADSDGVLNIDENAVYLTNPKLADTDSDGLKDGEEIGTYKTDPNKTDTDVDGLVDGLEVAKYKTNPVLSDTDGDGFSDGEEVTGGSDPLDKASTPGDKNANRVADSWELKYNIQIKDGSQDTDGDGVADVLEYQYGSDPTKIDTDADGYTDSEEILDYHSDPNDANSPGSVENLPVIINNFQYGQVIADSSPLIKGIGPASLAQNVVQIQILLRNEFGSELMLGGTQTDAKGGFVFIPTIQIKDGTYFLLARSINKGEVKMSQPLKIIVDSKLQVAVAQPKKLETAPITDEVLLKNLTLKVDSADGRPVLYGNLSEFGSRVNVTWQSLVVSSALIADTTDGSFSVKSPKLPEGLHTVYVQTVRKSDNAVGKTLRINFNLGLVQNAPVVKESNGGPSLQGATAVISDFISHQSWPFWIAVVVVVLLVGGGLYIFVLGDDDGAQKKK